MADYRSLASPEGVWAFGRGERHVVVLNMSDAPVVLGQLAGTIGSAPTGPAMRRPCAPARSSWHPSRASILERS